VTDRSWPAAAGGDSPVSGGSIRPAGFGNANRHAVYPQVTHCRHWRSSDRL